jgi:hypothetical protein
LGLMNLPGLPSPQAVNGFMVCRRQEPDTDNNWTHPPELADDLGDYVQPQRLPAAAEKWRGPLKDTAFAQASALARLRYEHFRRLCASHQVDAGAIGWSSLAGARHLFGEEHGRAALMLTQLDAYLTRLEDEFSPQALLVAGTGFGSRPGAAMILAPDMIRTGRWEQDTWQEFLATLLILAGLPAPSPERAMTSLLTRGED